MANTSATLDSCLHFQEHHTLLSSYSVCSLKLERLLQGDELEFSYIHFRNSIEIECTRVCYQIMISPLFSQFMAAVHFYGYAVVGVWLACYAGYNMLCARSRKHKQL